MLTLTIKKRWFDMILSGEKKEEYREIKPYYQSRFKNIGLLDAYGLPVVMENTICFRNGYGKNRPTFAALCSIDIRSGKEEWGAEPGREYYVLRILEVRE